VVKNKSIKRDLVEEIDLLDTMLTSLVDLLEEKKLITHKEWEQKIKKKVEV